MSDENRLLKRLRQNTVKYVRDASGKIIGIEDPAAKFRVTASGTMQPGPAGRDGTDGVDGAAGHTGPAGKDGKDGAPGRDGVDGKDGAPGIAGTNGTNGLDGAPGKDGAKGADSTVPGPQGPAGVAGKDGAQGIAGKDGAAGKDAKRIENYAGTTDSNGVYTVTFATPFAAIPTIQPEPPALPNQVWVKVNATVNGFSIRLVQRNTVNLLNIEVLLGATVNVANAPARVSVIAP